MIELSKCPNCASDDRVTIAGKDFCMHCGTASEDNAMIAASSSQYSASTPSASGVSKFTSSTTQPATAAASDTSTTSQPTDLAAGTTTSAGSAQQVADPLANQNPATEVAPTQLQPSQDPTTPQQPIPTPVAESPADAQPTTANSNEDAAAKQVEAKINELSTAAALPQTASANIPISTLPQNDNAVLAKPEAPQIPMQQTGEASPSPQTQPAANPAAMDSISAMPTATTASKTMPGSVAMSLDKNEPGVFSDEELHQLSNTQIDSPFSASQEPQAQPSSAAPAPVNEPMPRSNTMPAAMPMASAASSQPQAAGGVMPSLSAVPADKPGKSGKVLKPVGVAISVLLVFAVGFYMWRTNYASLAFKIASSKAGINATMPGYVPNGYNLNGNIQASPGSVSYNLASQSNGKIQITQSKTDWDSQALAENYVAPKADNYLALQAQGLTIYMLGNNQASWVNKGTWYRIESPNGTMTQEQVIKMATSL